MQEWYYVKDGQQQGPVSLEQLRDMVSNGSLTPNDLVWNATMINWSPANQVSGLFSQPVALVAAEGTPVVEGLPDIVPGSEPIDPVTCIKRGFELTKRHFSSILAIGAVYFAILIAMNIIVNVLQSVSGAAGQSLQSNDSSPNATLFGVFFVIQIIVWVISAYLALGITRVGLNLISGKPVEISQLFGEGDKLLRAMGASILFAFAVMIGFLLLIIPGIYIALRYGQFMKAIVDRDLGVMDAFSYSASITTNNLMNLLMLGILSFCLIIVGFLALCIGYFFALPIVWLAGLVAYRWMQSGFRAAQD